MHCLGEGWRNLLTLCSLADSSRVTTGWLAWEFFWWFSVPRETSICPSGMSAAFRPHQPTAAPLGFFPALLSVQTCQHFLTDGCLQQWTQSLNISRGLQETLGAHLGDRLAALQSAGWGKQWLPWEAWGRRRGRWRRAPRAHLSFAEINQGSATCPDVAKIHSVPRA